MKFLIIEDDQEIVETIKLILKIGWPDCECVSTRTGKSGLELIGADKFDVVILDLGLPDISGYSVLKELRSFSEIPVVIVTVRKEEADIVKGLELGADDYLIKPFGQMELLARLKAVLRRVRPDADNIPITFGSIRFSPTFSKLSLRGKEISLTTIESLILYELMKNEGVVLNNTQLAEKIWGGYYPGVEDSIRVYIRRLRQKIETNPNHPRMIITKVGSGYYMQK